MNKREMVEKIWRAGVENVRGKAAVKTALVKYGDQKFDGIIAVGKAASAMMAAAIERSRALNHADPAGLVVTKYDHVADEDDLGADTQIIEAAHPIPDENSLSGGRALLDFVAAMKPEQHLLVLVSGGASAVAEVLDGDISLEDLQKRTDNLIARGEPIDVINAARRKMSKLKDGKLLACFRGAEVQVMAISDVQGDDIRVIGSGIGMVNRAPEDVAVNSEIIASNELARGACANTAQEFGLDVICNIENAYGDIRDVAAKISDELKTGPGGVYIWGGEPTVVLPEHPGEGGRNQHLALLLARMVKGIPNIEIIVGGTDGTDGPTNAAGGFVSGGIVHNAQALENALANADARNYLARFGDLLVTGPTGTNVMDLIVAIKSD